MPTTGAAVLDLHLDQLASLFRLLSDRTRLSILLCLSDGERNVSSLCEQLNLPQPTVSHHLSLLRINNLIVNHRRGKQVYYTLNAATTLADQESLQIDASPFVMRLARKPSDASVDLNNSTV